MKLYKKITLDYGNLLYNSSNGKIVFFPDDQINEEFLYENDFFDKNDELAKISDSFPQKVDLKQLYLVVTTDCNMACKYCRQELTRECSVKMSFQDIKNSIDIYFLNSRKLDSVVFYGGEPLMNYEGIKYAISYIKSVLGENNEVKYSLITNATLCTKEIAKFIKKQNMDVIVSIDGYKQLNDLARIDLQGKSTYSGTVQGIENLKEFECCFGTNTVLGPHNEYQIKELVDWLINEIKPNTVGFALPHGNEENYAMDVKFNKLYKEMIWAYEELKRHGISLIQVERKIKDIVLNKVNSFECRAAKNRLVGYPDMKIGVCEGAAMNEDFFFRTFEEAESLAYKLQETTPLTVPACVDCIAKRVCGGGCPYDKLLRYGRIDCSDKYRCGFVIEVFQHGLKFIGKRMSEEFKEPTILDDVFREKLYKEMNYSKNDYVPLQFNCEAEWSK